MSSIRTDAVTRSAEVTAEPSAVASLQTQPVSAPLEPEVVSPKAKDEVYKPPAGPMRYIPVVERSIQLLGRTFQSFDGLPAYRGDLRGLTGESMRIQLPDPRLLKMEGVSSEQAKSPIAVFCPCCAHTVGWNGTATQKPIRIMCIRYAGVGFDYQACGRDRVEWRSGVRTMVCQYGHLLRFHEDTSGVSSVRAWPSLSGA
jgi:hypothetical protein